MLRVRVWLWCSNLTYLARCDLKVEALGLAEGEELRVVRMSVKGGAGDEESRKGTGRLV